jgi:hypothetical protein
MRSPRAASREEGGAECLVGHHRGEGGDLRPHDPDRLSGWLPKTAATVPSPRASPARTAPMLDASASKIWKKTYIPMIDGGAVFEHGRASVIEHDPGPAPALIWPRASREYRVSAAR